MLYVGVLAFTLMCIGGSVFFVASGQKAKHPR